MSEMSARASRRAFASGSAAPKAGAGRAAPDGGDAGDFGGWDAGIAGAAAGPAAAGPLAVVPDVDGPTSRRDGCSAANRSRGCDGACGVADAPAAGPPDGVVGDPLPPASGVARPASPPVAPDDAGSPAPARGADAGAAELPIPPVVPGCCGRGADGWDAPDGAGDADALPPGCGAAPCPPAPEPATDITPPQRLQRARIPEGGTLAGSIR